MASVSGSTKGRTPISAYPLFPACVALWFAALFGLSSIAVGVPNLERAIAAVQLQLVLPAAAPPLGPTARALIALGMTGLGGVLGLAIGWLIARRHRPPVAARPDVAVRPRDTHPDAPLRRPIFAHEEFGDAEDEDPEAVRDMRALRASRARLDSTDDFTLPSFLADHVAVDEAPPAAAFGLPIGEAAERIAKAELKDLAPVELLERMAIAMQARLDRRARQAEAAPEAAGTVTVFPSPEPKKTPQETEKALREALETLHRMTGAA